MCVPICALHWTSSKRPARVPGLNRFVFARRPAGFPVKHRPESAVFRFIAGSGVRRRLTSWIIWPRVSVIISITRRELWTNSSDNIPPDRNPTETIPLPPNHKSKAYCSPNPGVLVGGGLLPGGCLHGHYPRHSDEASLRSRRRRWMRWKRPTSRSNITGSFRLRYFCPLLNVLRVIINRRWKSHYSGSTNTLFPNL